MFSVVSMEFPYIYILVGHKEWRLLLRLTGSKFPEEEKVKFIQGITQQKLWDHRVHPSIAL